MKSNLGKIFEVLEGEIPEDFISIANDPAGNEILLGVSGEYQGKVYFWIIHDRVSEQEMDNMFILASLITYMNLNNDTHRKLHLTVTTDYLNSKALIVFRQQVFLFYIRQIYNR